MLRVKNITKSFDNFKALDDISFNVSRGQILGFLGPNGAGKTTTMRIIAGILTPDHGSVTLCNQDILNNPELAKRTFGYLPEGAPLYEEFCPLEYLNFIASAKQIPESVLDNHFSTVIKQTMIQDVLYLPISSLSKGYKRRVALAGALLGNPPILILDEPTDGLDPNQKRHIQKLLKTISKDKAIIISTHILDEVKAICNQTITINHGQIIAEATPKELMSMSSNYNAVTLIVDTLHCDSCLDDIKNLTTIDHIVIKKKLVNWTKVIIYPKKKKYILDQISEIIYENEYPIAEIRCEAGCLNEVFYKLTMPAEQLTDTLTAT